MQSTLFTNDIYEFYLGALILSYLGENRACNIDTISPLGIQYVTCTVVDLFLSIISIIYHFYHQ